MNSDDGARVYVNGTLIINAWTDRSASDTPAVGSINLVAGNDYPVTVEYYENGVADASFSWDITLPPAPPSATLSLSGYFSGGSVVLNWNSDSAASYYRVYRAVQGATDYTFLAQSPQSASPSYVDSSGTPGTNYYYAVRAFDSGGNFGPASNDLLISYPMVPAPTNLRATANPYRGGIDLAWESFDGATSWTIYRAAAGSDYSVYSYANTNSYLDTGYNSNPVTVPGTTYYYQVVAGYSTGKQSARSNAANAVFPAPAPGKPLNIAATPGDRQVTLTWTAPPGPVSKYQIAYSHNDGTQTFTIPAPAPTATSGTLDNVLGPYTVSGSSVNFTVPVTGLSNRTNYYFQVRAVNDAGTGLPTDTVGATPDVADDALVVSSTFPATMTAGKSYTGTIVMRNIGTDPWTTLTADNSQGYYLACADGKSPFTWGLGAVRFAEPGPIGRNGTATFTFTVTAPTTPNTYPFLWSMVHQRVGLFGDATTGSVAVAVGVAVPDGGFETPSVAGQSGNFQYTPPGAPWTFSAGSGISGNSGTFTGGNPSAPEGVQVGFLQGGGTISQVLPGFQAGASYTLTVAAAQRSGNTQTVQVSMDGTALGTFTPTDTTYRDYSVNYTAPASGSHTLTFSGLNSNGGDNTALIDNVRLTQNVQISRADVTLIMTYDKSVLCAGGWDRGTKTYTYLVKESQPATRAGRGAGDPHVAVLTATVTDAGGQPLAGKTVTLTWNQPGLGSSDDALPVNFTATTNAQGQISTIAISGDVVGNVPIAATCGQAQATLTLDYQAPQVQWLYQLAGGNWQYWDGTLVGLQTGADASVPVPLKAVLTYNGSPVVGHTINWLISEVLDFNGSNVLPDANGQFYGYGHFSGPISTTGSDGSATATFTLGFSQGQFTTDVNDNGVYDAS